jgi:hypothetical protein
MAQTFNYSERRFYTRFQYITDATLVHEQRTIHGETTDISLKGVHIKAGSQIPPGATVQVLVFPRQKPALSFSGTVVRSDNAGLGIEISNMPVESFSYIRDLVISKSGSPADIWDEVLNAINYIN